MKRLLAILVFFNCIIFYAQSPIEHIAKSYFQFYKYPKEHFVCQFNKENYYPGEDVYFQLFVLDDREKKLFLETEKVCLLIYDNEGKRILKKYLSVKNGLSSNSFTIPKNYKSSVLFYKIVSNWSLNFRPQKAKPIFINVENEVIKEGDVELKNIKINPEANKFIHNLMTIVNVNASNKNYKGIPIEGTVKDNKNEEVAYFKTDSLGYGRFFLKPKFGQNYYAEIVSGSDTFKYKLPKVSKKGLVFNIIEKDKDFYFGFRGNLNSVDSLYYMIHSQGKIGVAGNLKLDKNQKNAFYFSKEKLLKGINTLSIFKGTKLIGVRSFFNSYGLRDIKKIQISQTRINKDSVQFTLTNKLKDSIIHLSISILPKENKSVLKNQLFKQVYLSQIQESMNTIHFNDTEDIPRIKNFFSTHQLTNNWVRILENDTISINHFFEKGFSFRGVLRDKKNGNILKNTTVNFFTDYEAGSFNTDENGFFSIKDLFFYNGEQIKIHPQTKKKIYAKYQPKIQEEKYDTLINVNLKKTFYGKDIISKSISPFFDDSYEELKEIELRTQKKEKKDISINPLDNTTFTEKLNVNEENVYNFRTVLQYLESKASLIVDSRTSFVSIYNQRTNSQTIIANGGVKPMNIYVNQVLLRQQDVEMLKEMYMHQVKSIRINKSGIGGGGQDPFGSINIYLNKKGIFKKMKKNFKKDSEVLFVNLLGGFSKSKKYSTPEYIYEIGSTRYNQFATLHWEPNITLTKKEFLFKAQIPEKIKNYTCLIQGISSNGNIVELKIDFTDLK